MTEAESRIADLELQKRKARRLLIWQIVKVVSFPIVVILGFFISIIFGAVLGIATESLKKINK